MNESSVLSFHGGPYTFLGNASECLSRVLEYHLLDGYRNNAVIVTDENIKDIKHYKIFIEAMENIVHKITQVVLPIMEPRVETIEQAHLSIPKQVDLFLGYGGGSVMDSAKVLAVMHSSDCSLYDLYSKKRTMLRHSRLVLVPTTAGTGSDLSPVAVFIKNQEKVAIWSFCLRSDISIIDPLLAQTCPKRTIESSGIDAFIHALESLISKNATFSSSIMSKVALGYIYNGLSSIFFKNSINSEYFRLICKGILLSTVSYGYGGCGGIHALAYPLSGRYKVRHGEANAIMLLPVLSYNMAMCPQIIFMIAQAFGNSIDTAPQTIQYEHIIAKVADLLDHTSLPRTLRDIGVKKNDIPALAVQSQKAHLLLPNNPVTLSRHDADMIYGLAYEGETYEKRI